MLTTTPSYNLFHKFPVVALLGSCQLFTIINNGGVGRGQWGEGITGTTIKDTWTKSRGWVEVGEGGGFSWGGVEKWGENADN